MLLIQKKLKPNGKYHIFESLTTLCGMNYSDLTGYGIISDDKNKTGYLCPLCKNKNISQPFVIWENKFNKKRK